MVEPCYLDLSKEAKKKVFEIQVVQAAATRVTEKAVPNSGEFEIT